MNRSLSGDTKDALANELPQNNARRALLAAALLAYGGRRSEHWTTRRLSIARALHRLIPGSTIQKGSGRASFIVRCTGPVPRLPSADGIRRGRSLRRTELRGAFLACGSLSVGRRGGYHLEFAVFDPALAERLSMLIAAESLEVGSVSRRDHVLVYLKDAEKIIALLTAVGAFATVLQLEDLRAVKETKNRIRRIVNTEAANLDRTISAAAAARVAIEALAEAGLLTALSPLLREAADLRLSRPMASLVELGARCRLPVGKSTFSGRLAALRRLAERL